VAQVTNTNWRVLAACRPADPDLFSPVSSAGKSLEQADKAKAVCGRCMVRRQCLAFALRTRQAHGIRGGLTAEERSQQRPARPATAPAANG
jgi:WhiB family transcriptional regulator, redox-sensing transcriptional regulator